VVRRRLALACVLLVALAGCASRVPAVEAPTRSAAPPTTEPPTTTAALPPPVLPLPSTLPSAPSPTGFAEGTVASCAGKPAVDKVIALVRAKGIVDGTGTVSAQVGPLCAGTWQYTILVVPGREPLQVVTEGQPTALVLVTAGTDVCTDQVRASAPVGIVAAAHCA
jgi:hypothetical protein